MVSGRWKEQFFSETSSPNNHTTRLCLPEYPHLNNHHRIIQYNITSTARVLEPTQLFCIIDATGGIIRDK